MNDSPIKRIVVSHILDKDIVNPDVGELGHDPTKWPDTDFQLTHIEPIFITCPGGNEKDEKITSELCAIVMRTRKVSESEDELYEVTIDVKTHKDTSDHKISQSTTLEEAERGSEYNWDLRVFLEPRKAQDTTSYTLMDNTGNNPLKFRLKKGQYIDLHFEPAGLDYKKEIDESFVAPFRVCRIGLR